MGGDECVIGRREGNQVDILHAFREADSVQVVGRVARILKDNQIWSVDADAGGLGGPLCDQLAEHGISVCRIHNGSPARESDKFANQDAGALVELPPSHRTQAADLAARR
jgi:hypothetical protein